MQCRSLIACTVAISGQDLVSHFGARFSLVLPPGQPCGSCLTRKTISGTPTLTKGNAEANAALNANPGQHDFYIEHVWQNGYKPVWKTTWYYVDVRAKSLVNQEERGNKTSRKIKLVWSEDPLLELGWATCVPEAVSSHWVKVHKVAHDVHTNKTKLSRYGAVALVELTDNDDRQRHLDRNRELCETDPLMPKWSPSIKYACLTNTNFVH